MPDYALVLMPFVELIHPSIGLGILKASLEKHNFSCRVYYPGFALAEKTGVLSYRTICNVIYSGAGEWIFSEYVFPGFQPDNQVYLNTRMEKSLLSDTILQKVRKLVPAFIDETARAILKDNPRIIGVSSVFQQQCASLALLKRIRELNPDVITMMGGSNCEGIMGRTLHRECTWIDFVFSGLLCKTAK